MVERFLRPLSDTCSISEQVAGEVIRESDVVAERAAPRRSAASSPRLVPPSVKPANPSRAADLYARAAFRKTFHPP
jgi:hypothetical protein